MNHLFGQSTPVEPTYSDEAASEPSSATRPFPSANAKRAFFRLDLLRSLQMHRGLALGITLAGLIAGGAYFLKMRPVNTAQVPVKTQPAAAGPAERASRQDKPMVDNQLLAMAGEERGRIQDELATERTVQDALNKQLGVAANATGSPSGAASNPLIANASPYGYDFNIGRIRAEVVKARADHDAALARLTSMDASNAPPSAALDAAVAELIATDPGLWGMKLTLTQRHTMVMWKVANTPPNYPAGKQDEAELAQLNSTLDSMAKDLRAKAATRIQERLQADLDRTSWLEAQLGSQLGQQTLAVGNLASKQLLATDLTADIARLQARYASVDGQLHKLTPNEAAASESPLSSAAAATHPATSGLPQPDRSNVLRNALLIVLAGLLFGILAAVVANKRDPRVYIAADVEQVLGIAPMALLPDFNKVSTGVAEDFMLRFAAAIEHARQQGNRKSFVITGAGPGTGATTVATRVKEMLEGMGRKTVLVNASAILSPSQGAGQNDFQHRIATQRGNGATTPMQQSGGKKPADESLVLTDAAPLVASAETECLARFADCTIIVVESGVTTREQLRVVAGALQRLNMTAVGFVLNRVAPEKADSAFLLSIQAIEEHLNAHSGPPTGPTVTSIDAKASNATGQASKAVAKRNQARAVASEPIVGLHLSSPSVPDRPAVSAEVAPGPAIVSTASNAGKNDIKPASPEPSVLSALLYTPAVSTPASFDPAPPVAQPKPAPLAVDPAKLFTQPLPAPPSFVPEPEFTLPKPAPRSVVPAPEFTEQVSAPLSVEPSTQLTKPVLQNPQIDATPAARPLQPAKPQQPQAASSWIDTLAQKDRPQAAAAKSLERALAMSETIKPAASIEELRQPQLEQSGSDSGSRTGGLRGLLFGRSGKNSHKTANSSGDTADFLKQLDKAIEQPTPAQITKPTVDTIHPIRSRVVSSSPGWVTAQAEFLPPRPMVETTDNESADASHSQTGSVRKGPHSDVEILASLRSQQYPRMQ